ncbi:Pro-kumamolisin, activation domain-containing protein [Mycena sp. CBHHK59/15]|nr:Pro-kumamolisin, activation domain-containing protein [Mycena sp. CBHHK59/15]
MRSSITVSLAPRPPRAPHAHPAGWERHDKLAVDAVLPLRIGLVQPNIANLDALLHDVSHPDSPNYGAHWTPQRVAETFAPSGRQWTPCGWLVNSGFARERIRVSGSRIWVEVNATVAEAEKLLNTEYHVYKHTSGKKHISCTAYHVPAHLRHHIDLITPTLHFTAIISSNTPYVTHPARSATNTTAPSVLRPFSLAVPAGLTAQQYLDLSKCDQHMTPICLRALYGLSSYTPKATALNSFGIVEYSPTPSFRLTWSLRQHLRDGPRQQAAQYREHRRRRAADTQTGFDWNGESNLDLQYGMALVTGAQPVTLYQTGDQVEGASFNDFLDALDGRTVPRTAGTTRMTTQYTRPVRRVPGPQGMWDRDVRSPALSKTWPLTFCVQRVRELGLMGVTFLYSSGDNGVAGNSALCLNADGSQSTSGTRFNPTFPGSCPYITSVGATQVLPGHTVLNPESACASVIYSGGGFSNYFAIPDYQKTQVQGQFYLVFGTSASAPVVGAILTLVNDARLNAGKSPIGFINPTIYSSAFASAFNDVTNGNNPGCGTQVNCYMKASRLSRDGSRYGPGDAEFPEVDEAVARTSLSSRCSHVLFALGTREIFVGCNIELRVYTSEWRNLSCISGVHGLIQSRLLSLLLYQSYRVLHLRFIDECLLSTMSPSGGGHPPISLIITRRPYYTLTAMDDANCCRWPGWCGRILLRGATFGTGRRAAG